PSSAWMPDEGGTLLLRVPHADRFVALERAFEAGCRPPMSAWQPYAQQRVQSSSPSGPWCDTVVVRFTGGPHRLPLITSLRTTRAWREQLKDIFRQPPFNEEPPEVVSGRAPYASGHTVTQSPHVAFVPLPDVDHAHAGGHLLGLAILLPRVLKG